MPRTARLVVPGCFYHVTQRGNNRREIFICEEDYRHYLRLMEEYRGKFGLQIFAYCLMPNHVHFIVRPEQAYTLAKVFSIVHMRYAQYRHKKKETSGHLWQGRFFSCVLDESHFKTAVCYVENNPVRAKKVKKALHWIWSSARHHINKEAGLLSLQDIHAYIDVKCWREFLNIYEDEVIYQSIRENTMTGKVLGTPAFIQKLSQIIGQDSISLTKRKQGRPQK